MGHETSAGKQPSSEINGDPRILLSLLRPPPPLPSSSSPSLLALMTFPSWVVRPLPGSKTPSLKERLARLRDPPPPPGRERRERHFIWTNGARRPIFPGTADPGLGSAGRVNSAPGNAARSPSSPPRRPSRRAGRRERERSPSASAAPKMARPEAPAPRFRWAWPGAPPAPRSAEAVAAAEPSPAHPAMGNCHTVGPNEALVVSGRPPSGGGRVRKGRGVGGRGDARHV